MSAVQQFGSTGEAYDACQCGLVEDHAVLVIESEQVVGVAGTWPFAVTVVTGELHGVEEGFLDAAQEPGAPEREAVAAAITVAMAFGWAIAK